MNHKFEIGDRVIYKPENYICTILGIDRNTDGYTILYDDGEECYVHENELDFANPKAAFLTRLQELLATFDAEICAIVGEDDATNSDKPLMWIQIGDSVVNYERGLSVCDITADNVFDYDKD